MNVLTRLADRTLIFACNVSLLALLAVVMAGVVSRALDRPVVWSDELSRFLMVWLSFLGWTLATRNHAHLRVGLVLDRLPPRLQRVIEAFIQAITGSIGLAFLWFGLTLVGRNAGVQAVTMPIPAALLYVPLLFTGAVMALESYAQAWRHLQGTPYVGFDDGATP